VIDVKIKLLRPTARLPERMTAGAAGLDCRSAARTEVRVYPDCRAVVPLGFAVEVPEGWVAHLVPRSGHAFKHGVVEYWGTIDSDYRGEVKALLFNHGDRAYDVQPGERVCQMIFSRVPEVTLTVVDELSGTARGENGVGSTGRGESLGFCRCTSPRGNVDSESCSTCGGIWKAVRRAVIVHEQHCAISTGICNCSARRGS
jgi:dUTP pyrophosphatase